MKSAKVLKAPIAVAALILVVGAACWLIYAQTTSVKKAAGYSGSLNLHETLLGATDLRQISPAFGRNGSHFGYLTFRGGKALAVVDGKVSKGYDKAYTGNGYLAFSSDGKHVAYAACGVEKCFVVLDGQEGTAYDDVASPSFSPDSKRLAYWASKGGKWRVVLDGQEMRTESDHNGAPVTFSPDSKRVAYCVKREDKWLVVVDDEVRSAAYAGYFDLIFSADSKRLIFAVSKGSTDSLVVDGKEIPDRDVSGRYAFSPDGKRVAFESVKDGKWRLVMDGQELGPEYDWLGDLAFSPDGKHFAYCAKKGDKLSVIEDDTKGAGYDEIAEGTLIFSPDGRHLAYAARNGSKWLLVSDGRPSPEYDEVIKNSLVFSSDGNHVAYAVRVGNLSWTIVDGHSSAKYSSVLGGTMSFGQGGRLEFLSVKPTQVPQGNGSQKYELLDHPAEDYGIEAELSVTEEVQASDCSGDIEGKVELLEAGGRILDLNTPEIVHEDGKAWIVTRDYGKIRVSGGYAGDRPPSGLCFWLTQAQKAQLNPLFGSLYRVQFAP